MIDKNIIKTCFEHFLKFGVLKTQVRCANLTSMQKYKESLPKNFYHVYPYSAMLKITSACNLRCKHCFYSGTPEIYNSDCDYNIDEWINIVNFLVDEFNILNLIITGGEPFLKKDFLKLIKHVKQKSIPLVIQTNGTLLDEKVVDELATLLYCKTDSIQISLEASNADAHELIRGKGTFDKTIKAIKLLRVKNIPVQLNLTLTSISAPTIKDIFKLCVDLGISNVSINRFTVCFEEQEYLNLSLEELFYYSSQIYQELEKYPMINARIKALNIFDFLKNDYGRDLVDEFLLKNPDRVRLKRCLACHNHNKLTIASNGNVYLCSMDESEETILGNIREKNLVEIWENRYLNPYFQERNIETIACKNCKYIALCQGGCIVNAYKKYGDINMPDAECPYSEEYLRSQNG